MVMLWFGDFRLKFGTCVSMWLGNKSWFADFSILIRKFSS